MGKIGSFKLQIFCSSQNALELKKGFTTQNDSYKLSYSSIILIVFIKKYNINIFIYLFIKKVLH